MNEKSMRMRLKMKFETNLIRLAFLFSLVLFVSVAARIDVSAATKAPDAPKASLKAGTYNDVKKVTLTAAADTDIYYTLDGTTPTASSKKYTSSIKINKSAVTLKAIAKKDNTTSKVLSVNYKIVPSAPVTSLKAGTYKDTKEVTLSSAIGGTIYYTLDGKTPTVNSTKYSDPITIDKSKVTLKAIVKKGCATGKVLTVNYKIDLAVPKVDVKGGTYKDTKVVQLSNDINGDIYYTLDGKAPTTSSTKYKGPITIDKNKVTLKAIVKKGEVISKVFTANYSIALPAPVVSVKAGTYKDTQTVSLSSLCGGDIYYTLDGTSPATNSNAIKYTTPITIDKSAVTLKAVVKKGDAVSSILSAAYKITLPATTISVKAGTYQNDQTIEIYSTLSGGAKILYTTDGSTPSLTSATSKEYLQPITISQTTTIKAIVCKGQVASAVMSAAYNLKVGAMSVSVKAGTYTADQKVDLTCVTTNADIYYTTDGTAPTSSSTKYTGPITITNNATLKAIGIKGNEKSAVLTAAYKINKAESPTFSLEAGNYVEYVFIGLTAKTSGSTIYYTTDGTEPTAASTKYVTPIYINKNTVVKAVAVKSGFGDSLVSSSKYEIIPDTSGKEYAKRNGYVECTEIQKTYYDQIYDAIKLFKTTITLPISASEFSLLYMRVNSDNPELFYMPSGYSYTVTNVNVIVSWKYSVDAASANVMMLQMKTKANQILAAAGSKNTFDKIKYIHDQLILGGTYGSSSNAHNAYGILIEGKGVCESYAEAFQYICQLADIPVMVVRGNAGGSHEWNMVYLDGEWYCMDVTWDDPTGMSADYIGYAYFLLTSEQMSKDHTLYSVATATSSTGSKNYYSIPTATGTKYNYYVYNKIDLLKDVTSTTAEAKKQLEAALKTKESSFTLLFTLDNSTVQSNFISTYLTKKVILTDMQELNATSADNKYAIKYSYMKVGNEITIYLSYQ